MKKILLGALLLTGMSAMAQETYENANIMAEDLNGTARYVGMGGAMEALGADISTIGTNPAGVGMFRKSQASLTTSVITQPGAPSTDYVDATKWSFDQAGFVWSSRIGNTNYLNFGFNYKKSRNYAGILSVQDRLNNASQNKLTAAKGYEGIFDTDNCYNQVDYLNENVLGLWDENEGWSYFNGTGYDFQKETQGYVGEYDFNISGNVSNSLYLGLTVGIKDVNYDAWTSYYESLTNYEGQGIGRVHMMDHRMIDGSGFDMKFGAIWFPVQGSPFRIGASIATPTWYDLTTSNYTSMTNGLDKIYDDHNNCIGYGAYDDGNNDESYDYRMYTPWKFGVSAGHTVANSLALGISYEYAGYQHSRSRVIDGVDYYGETSSYNDGVMNAHTKATLKGVSTLKVGAEYKFNPNWAIRAGYNFVTGMYNMDGYRDGALNSPGTYYSSTTDYTNWKATNRVTLGLGYAIGGFALDLAYQYTTTSGEFAPFMSYYGETAADDCVADAVKVDNNRHQFMATLSYKF